MTTLEFVNIANEYARGHAANISEMNIVLDFAQYFLINYGDELFTNSDAKTILEAILNTVSNSQDAESENQNGNIYPPIEKETTSETALLITEKKNNWGKEKVSYHFPKDFEEAKKCADLYMETKRRFNHHLSNGLLQYIDICVHEFARQLVLCSAQSQNELQDFINNYYDTLDAVWYSSDIESAIYATLVDFANYILL